MMELIREPSFLTVDVRGRLTRDDCDRITPRIEEELALGRGRRVLLRVHDFHGWTPAALLEELRFDVQHRRDFERVAVVGERLIERVGTDLAKPLFAGPMQFFEEEERARDWLTEPVVPRERVPRGVKALAGLFAFSGLAKLFGARPLREAFAEWGYDRSFMYAVGLAEVIGAAGLLAPATRRPAALGLSALMGGAIATHLANQESAKSLPAVLTLISAAKLAKPRMAPRGSPVVTPVA